MLHALTNPLLDVDCPDPCLVPVDGGWLLVGTTFFDDVAPKLPMWRSEDGVRFRPCGHVFPAGDTPRWAIGQYWAPEIHRVGGRWLCYFTARDTTGRLCIGVASSDDIEGPWRDSGAPMLRDAHVGLIDAHRFEDDDGRAYLFWKVDGNDLSPQQPTPIRVQELAPDGLSLLGDQDAGSVTAFHNDLPWEGEVVEGPWAVRRGEHVYVFYSGHAFHTPAYATGVARARHVLGPYEKLETPLLVSGERWRGPGHGCVVRAGDDDLFVYHAWDGDAVFGRHPRIPLVGRVRWSGGWPSIEPAPERTR